MGHIRRKNRQKTLSDPPTPTHVNVCEGCQRPTWRSPLRLHVGHVGHVADGKCKLFRFKQRMGSGKGQGSRYSSGQPGWPRIHYLDQAGFKLTKDGPARSGVLVKVWPCPSCLRLSPANVVRRSYLRGQVSSQVMAPPAFSGGGVCPLGCGSSREPG